MASANLVLSLLFLLLLLFSSLPSSIVAKDDPGHVKVSVLADYVVARTDGNFICATVDWWPPEKCDFGDCSWGHTSIKNLVRISVSRSRVIRCMHAKVSCISYCRICATKSFVMQLRVSEAKDAILGVGRNVGAKFDAVVLTAFGTMRVRIGGTLQDQVTYTSKPCHEFKAADGDSDYEFKDGCISLNRWDKIHEFFNATGAFITFGINALHGRVQGHDGVYAGNELCGNGGKPNFLVDGKQYGLDLIAFKAMLIDEYAELGGPPKVAAPGGFYVEDWYKNMLSTSGYGVVDVITHHVYNLGSGGDRNLVDKVTNPKVLGNIVHTYDKVVDTIKSTGPWSSAWVGESGGAHSSGGKGLSNTFANNRFAGLTQPGGVTLLLINLSDSITLEIEINGSTKSYERKIRSRPLAKDDKDQSKREEFHLTPKDGDIQSTVMLLNGKELGLDGKNSIPALDPEVVNASDPLRVAPRSIAFVKLKDFNADACK
ncbi:hypothetical protein BHM03_00030842 [Ensete ventricosum]|nr:hypothetical protein BHM03_00030842 [Ensete ventricosum]